MGNNRRFWIALISVDWGAVLNFGSSACHNECSHTESERICDHSGWCNLRRQPSICSSNVLAAGCTKLYLIARFVVFQRLIPLFPLYFEKSVFLALKKLVSGNIKILNPNLVLESARRRGFQRKSVDGGRNSREVGCGGMRPPPGFFSTKAL